ncbi:hypothetical protein AXW84_00415 [Hymenobacter sp. PAMC 26628]|nr:hypothetical protein AXW84_00415 [Hymenobacter sp. PAMC 26628]
MAQGTAVYRINAGGGAVTNAIGAFAADAYFAGGSAYSTGAAVAGTANGAMYQSERAGAFGYALPVSNGKYTVVLHFAEIYWTQAGQRVFDVAAEGAKVLTRYDIVKKVGPLTATSETFAVTVADGVLNLDFSALASAGGVDQAKVAAIEVLVPAAGNQAPVANAGAGQSVTLPTSSGALAGSGTDVDGTVVAYAWAQVSGPGTAVFSSKAVAAPTVSGLVAGSYVFSLVVTDNQGLASAASTVTVAVNPATTGGVAYRINAGGGAVTNAIGAFAADAYFAGGSAYSTGAAVAGTANGAMYQSERAGAFGYALPVSNGKYTVVLHFAEIYWTQAGQRVFDVAAEGAKVLTRYDIVKKVGPLTATSETFAVTVADGVLNLDFSALASAGGVDQAKVAAIEVLVPAAGNQAPVANAGAGQSVTLPTSSGALAGSGTDVDGTVVAYAWAQVSGPGTAVFSSKAVAAPTVSGLVAGSYVFSLVVTDNQGLASAASTVTVAVNPATTGGVAYRINAGGGAVTNAIGAFAADAYFAGGSAYSTGAAVAGTANGAMYQSERAGAFGYALPVSNGKYTVVLHFAEIYWTQAGQRVFDVAAEGAKVLTRYDIVKKVGPLTATSETFAVTVADGVLNLDFSALASAGGVDQAKVAAIEVLAATACQGTATPTVTTPLAYCTGATADLLSSSVSVATGATPVLYATATGGTALAASFRPPTTSAGSITYYASQLVNGCESARVPIVVNVTNSPAAPVVTTPLTYCVGAQSALLSAGVTLTTGATLRLYASASGGTALADFAPATATLGSTTYYAAQALNGCESGRAAIVVNVTNGPAAPAVVSPLTYCVGAQSALLSAGVTLTTGATLRLYASASGGTALADFAPATAAAGSTTYYAAQLLNGCESGRAAVVVNVTNGPAAPVTVSSVGYCIGDQAALLSTGVTLTSGATLRLYASASGGAPSADFIPSTATAGTTTYYAAQLLNGCESGRTPLTVAVSSGPAKPNVTTPLTYCQGAAANLLSANVTLASGSSIRLYATASGGTALADFAPSTAAVGSTTYYVAQVTGSCESSRAPMVVNVTNSPAAPVVTTPLTYCVGAQSALLSAGVTLTTGATLRLYASASGGTALADFAPATATLGSTTYYAAQALNGCESGRAAIVVNVTNGPAAPAVVSPLTYCVGAQSALLSAGVTLTTGATLRLYASASGGTALADFAPATAAAGSTTYYAAQLLNGCESGRAAIVVNVTNGPAGPVATTPLTYCVGAQSALLSAGVALTSGATLRLYASATSTAALADFAPSTAAVGSTTYYAAQLLNGCESGRAAVVVNVVSSTNPLVLVPPAGVDTNNIAAWGDSFTDANYGLYPQVLAQLTGRTVYNGGIGGQTSVQIKDRLVAATAKYNWPVIIWAGRNDSDKPDQIKASIATMVATIGHSNYLILGLCNGEGEGIGTYSYGLIKPLNNDLAAIYGNHFLDVRAYLVAHYDPSQPQDMADYAADIPPTSLRQDFLHPNRAGSTLIANYINANMNLLMGATYCQGTVAKPLSSGVAMAAGASLRVYSSPTAATAADDFVPATTSLGSTTYYVTQAINGCETPRTPLTINVVNCTSGSPSSAASSATGGTGNGTAAKQSAVAADPVFEAYPNPFADEATINLTLATTQAYSLELYDSRGMLAKHVASGTAQGGTRYQYKVSSHDLAEGIYLVRLIAGKNSKMFKLTMAK